MISIPLGVPARPWDERAKDLIKAWGEALAKAKPATLPVPRRPRPMVAPKKTIRTIRGSTEGQVSLTPTDPPGEWHRTAIARLPRLESHMSTNVFLATDDETQGAVVRKVLLREGLDCPVANVVRVELAPQLLPRSPVDLIVVALPEDSRVFADTCSTGWRSCPGPTASGCWPSGRPPTPSWCCGPCGGP